MLVTGSGGRSDSFSWDPHLVSVGLFAGSCLPFVWRAWMTKKRSYSIIVHGGAYAIPDAIYEASESGCRHAVQAGAKVLQAGGTAVEAVEAAVNLLENDATFDAGYGSVLTSDGEVEMDAIVMDGSDLSVGAVACCTTVRNPISLARRVKDSTEHCMIVGRGSDRIARKFGFEEVNTNDLVTQAARDELKKFQAYTRAVNNIFNTHNLIEEPNLGHDTVGCVAIDQYGNMAAGTSTGGITSKTPGRVGDSPIVGSGAYADNLKGAVSTTGHGESIVKMCLAKEVVDSISSSYYNPEKVLQGALLNMKTRVNGCGGAIAVAPNGDVGVAFTTPRMCWASVEAFEGNEANVTLGKSGVDPGQVNHFCME